MSDISLFLQHGWNNIWKDKTLWLFSALPLVSTLIRLGTPNQESVNLTSSLLSLAPLLISLYLMYIGYAGVSYVAYCIAIGAIINIQSAFQAARKLFWRAVALILLPFLFLSPFLCLVFILSLKQPPQIADIAHNVFFISIPASIFAAIWQFALTETVMNDSGVVKSLKAAWGVFIRHFAVLAAIGVILIGTLYVINVSVGIIMILVQNNFDFAALGKLDFLTPHLSFTNNKLYGLISAIPQTVWYIFSASIFTLAYLKYSDAKTNKYFAS